jgi:hypothetical protein
VAPALPQLVAPPGYCPQAEDTSPETDLLCFYLLRQKTVVERLQLLGHLNRSARQFSINCFRQRFGTLQPQEFARKLAEAWLQEHCPMGYIPVGSEMTWIQDSLQLAGQLHTILMGAGVSYYVTGGIAAIAYGEVRTTQDVDIVLAIERSEVVRLAALLEQAGFYVPGVDDVLSGRMRTLQVTHMETISRADLIVAILNDYEQLKFDRKQAYPLPDGTQIYLASPEDVVINKLRWRQKSQSEKQWRDVLGVLKTQQEALDYSYLVEWAGVFDLLADLEAALVAAGVRELAKDWL